MVDVTRELEIFREEIRNCSEFELKAILDGLQSQKAQAKLDLQRLSSTRDVTGEARQYAQADAVADRELCRQKVRIVQDLIGKRRKIRAGVMPPGFEYLSRFHRAAELILPAHQLETVRAKAREIKQREAET